VKIVFIAKRVKSKPQKIHGGLKMTEPKVCRKCMSRNFCPFIDVIFCPDVREEDDEE
jgi:hypothetical protein